MRMESNAAQAAAQQHLDTFCQALQQTGLGDSAGSAALLQTIKQHKALGDQFAGLQGEVTLLQGCLPQQQPLQQTVFAVLFETELQQQSAALRQGVDEAARLLAAYAAKGQLYLAAALLRAVAPPQKMELLLADDRWGANALHHAVANGNEKLAALLLAEAVPRKTELLQAKNNRGETALHCAAAYGHAGLCTLFLKEAAQHKSDLLLAQNDKGETPLYCAASAGKKELCALLLKEAAHHKSQLLLAKDRWGVNALSAAATNGRTEVCQLLLASADADKRTLLLDKDGNGKNALHRAAAAGHADSCAQLLAALADGPMDLLLARDRKGSTPLCDAAAAGKAETCKVLLQAAGEHRMELLLKRDDSGATALHRAASEGKEESCRLLMAAAAPRCDALLLAHDNLGATALHHAALNGSDQLCQLLLDAAADEKMDLLLARDSGGGNALQWAAYAGSAKCCTALLAAAGQRKLDLLLEGNDNGKTALHNAAASGSIRTCRLLLEEAAGQQIALLSSADHGGRMALHYALSNNHFDNTLLTLLLEDLSAEQRCAQLAIPLRQLVLPLSQYVSQHNEAPLTALRGLWQLGDSPAADTLFALALLQNGRHDEALPLLPQTQPADEQLAPLHKALAAAHRKGQRGPPQALTSLLHSMVISQRALRLAGPPPDAGAAAARHALIRQIAAMHAPTAQRHTLMALLQLCSASAGSARFERLYGELVRPPPPDQQLERLTPTLLVLLTHYDDATVRQLAAALRQACSATALRWQPLRSALVDLCVAVKECALPDSMAVTLLCDILSFPVSERAIAKQASALRAIPLLGAQTVFKERLATMAHDKAQAAAALKPLQEDFLSLQQQLKSLQSSEPYQRYRSELKQLNVRDKQLRRDIQAARHADAAADRHTLEGLLQELRQRRQQTQPPPAYRQVEEQISAAAATLQQAQQQREALRCDPYAFLNQQLRHESANLVSNRHIVAVSAAFATTRYPEAPIIYLAGLLRLPEPDRSGALGDFTLWADNLDALRRLRYDVPANPHLSKLQALNPSLVKRWCALTADEDMLHRLQDIKVTQAAATQHGPDGAALLRRALLVDRHLPPERCPHLIGYLNADAQQRPACLKALEAALGGADAAAKGELLAQRHLISLLEDGVDALTRLDEVPRLMGLAADAPFRGDLLMLRRLYSDGASATAQGRLTLSDDPVDLLLVGSDVAGSCQNVSGDPSLSRGLLGYQLNGQTIPLGHKNNATGAWLSRALLRLVLVKGHNGRQGAALLLERIYPANAAPALRAELSAAAAFIARELGIDAISVEEGDEAAPYPGIAFLEKGRAYAEYVDAGGQGVVAGDDWPCRLRACRYLARKQETGDRSRSPT